MNCPNCKTNMIYEHGECFWWCQTCEYEQDDDCYEQVDDCDQNTPVNVFQSIPHLKGFLSHTGRNGIGKLGERLAGLQLEQIGYRVTYTQPNQRRGDLVITDSDGCIHRVEVKTARRNRDKKWRFLVYKKGQQDYRDADYLLLLAVTASGDCIPFVIPVSEIDPRSVIIITSDPRRYSGRWAAYRQTFNNLTLGA